MTSLQQQETLNYFRRAAAQWRQKAEGSIPMKVNVIKQRNDYVLKVAGNKTHLEHSLDVGCGTGQLVCELAKTGIKAVGVDFADEMIDICKQKIEAEGLTGAEFVHASIFDYTPDGIKFDLISANGFIECISEGQLLKFINHVKSLLAPAGSLVLGSRNRLFNAFSLNEYTQIELSKGVFQKLIAEALIFTGAGSLQEAIEELLWANDSLPPIDCHPSTNIEITTRCQYTPGQLVRLLRIAGFETVGLLPVHYHEAPPRFAREHPETHVEISNMIQRYAHDCHYLMPYASSFMLHAVRI